MAEERPLVLVPIAVLEGQAVPDAIIELLSPLRVVLLGYHEIPEQTAPEQARDQFEAKARGQLDDLVEAFEARGGSVETRLAFTHDTETTIERVAVELDCDVILFLNPAPTIERLLVPVRGAINLERITALVGRLVADTDLTATLFHAVADEEAAADGGAVLADAAARIEATGVEPERLSQEVVVTERPVDRLIEMADAYDAVVMGEDEPTIHERIFGGASDRVVAETLSPVLVVRRLVAEPEG